MLCATPLAGPKHVRLPSHTGPALSRTHCTLLKAILITYLSRQIFNNNLLNACAVPNGKSWKIGYTLRYKPETSWISELAPQKQDWCETINIEERQVMPLGRKIGGFESHINNYLLPFPFCHFLFYCLASFSSHTHTHTHTHTHAYTHTYARERAHTHTYARARARTRTPTNIHTSTQTQRDTHIHALTHSLTYDKKRNRRK